MESVVNEVKYNATKYNAIQHNNNTPIVYFKCSVFVEILTCVLFLSYFEAVLRAGAVVDCKCFLIFCPPYVKKQYVTSKSYRNVFIACCIIASHCWVSVTQCMAMVYAVNLPCINYIIYYFLGLEWSRNMINRQ